MYSADQWHCAMQESHSAEQNSTTRMCAERVSCAKVPCRPMALRHAETTFCRAEFRDADLRGEILVRQCTLQTNSAAPCRNDILPTEFHDADLRGEILMRKCTLQTNAVAPCRNGILLSRIRRRESAR